MRRCSLLLLVLAAPSAAFPPVPPTKPARPAFELKDLEGTWVVESCEDCLQGERDVVNEFVHIRKGTWVAVHVFPDGTDIKTVTYQLALDATKSPAVLDMTFKARDGQGREYGHSRKGIAELKGDRITVVYTLDKARPARLVGQLADGQERWVMKRKKR